MHPFIWGNFSAWIYFLIPLLAILIYIWGAKKQILILNQLLSQKALTDIQLNRNQSSQFLHQGLLVFILICITLALMEPKYDFTWETVHRKGIDIIIALDLSKSMYAKDISPNRFERSRLELKNLVENLEGDRIGLIVFTSGARMICPLTLDYQTFNLFLDDVSIGQLPRGGTSLSAPIEMAAGSFDPQYKKDRVLILVTDGESHDKRLDEALKISGQSKVRIFTVGLGSLEGVPILLPSDSGEKIYVKDEKGNIVLTKLEDRPLKKIALESGGAYVPVEASGFNLLKIYQEEIAPIEGREINQKRKRRYENRYYFPLGLALIAYLFLIFLRHPLIRINKVKPLDPTLLKNTHE